MRSIRQLLRQPLKTLAGILLTSIAVAVLCVSVSQMLAVTDTGKKLLETYMTVALPAKVDSPEKEGWLQELIQTRPDYVKGYYAHGLASAYVPGLTPDNYTQHKNGNQNNSDLEDSTMEPVRLSYAGCVLEVRVEADGVRILRALALPEGYADPTDFTLRLYCTDHTLASTMLQPGRYLVYGTDYYDLDWELRSALLENSYLLCDKELPQWDLSTLTYWKTQNGTQLYKCKIENLIHGLNQSEMQMFRKIHLTLQADAEQPCFVKLEGSAEDFLASDAGKIWQERLEAIEINAKMFPVVTTDQLSSYAGFVLGRANVSQGRSFTAEEIAAGASVCIISRYLAELNGLQVGDTIDMQYLNWEKDLPDQLYISDGKAVVNPAPYTYAAGMTMLSARSYTIVGLYEQDTPWASAEHDMYAFTPNTIFVPKAAAGTAADMSIHGQFSTLVLHSDKMTELQLLAVDAGLDGIFQYYNSGYDRVAGALSEFEAAAKQVLPIGLVIYGLLMFLFIFLFPGRESQVLTRMDSLGAGHLRRVGHIVAHSAGIALPGSLIGGLVALQLWDYVARALSGYMGAEITLTLDTDQLWVVAAIQAAAVLVVCGLVGTVISHRVNFMRRK